MARRQTKRLDLLVEPDTAEWLRAEADRLGVSVAGAVRSLVANARAVRAREEARAMAFPAEGLTAEMLIRRTAEEVLRELRSVPDATTAPTNPKENP